MPPPILGSVIIFYLDHNYACEGLIVPKRRLGPVFLDFSAQRAPSVKRNNLISVDERNIFAQGGS